MGIRPQGMRAFLAGVGEFVGNVTLIRPITRAIKGYGRTHAPTHWGEPPSGIKPELRGMEKPHDGRIP